MEIAAIVRNAAGAHEVSVRTDVVAEVHNTLRNGASVERLP